MSDDTVKEVVQATQDDLDQIVGACTNIRKRLAGISRENEDLANIVAATERILLEVSLAFSLRYKTK